MRYDVVVIGAGAAGMMCAATAGQRNRRVLLLEHGSRPGEKIRISGGGRCNFTNLATSPTRFISENPRFCVSALSRYTPMDFVSLVEQYDVAYHEKAQGQLFCDGSAQQIVGLLVAEMQKYRVEVRLNTAVQDVTKSSTGFSLVLMFGANIECTSLVIATGGKSIPKMGATDFGYRVAAQFGLKVLETRPGLVPLTFAATVFDGSLAGVAVNAGVTCGAVKFEEALLFTHRGLSGPAILQISSYWREGSDIEISLLPNVDFYATLRSARTVTGKISPHNLLATLLPRRLAKVVADEQKYPGTVADQNDITMRTLGRAVNAWRLRPSGTEGYRVAEVTLGGVDTKGLDSRTMAAKSVPGLYFIGEVVDVAGWLGGYNFQWAWASGWCAGSAV